jgi:putative phage-type endonuclease
VCDIDFKVVTDSDFGARFCPFCASADIEVGKANKVQLKEEPMESNKVEIGIDAAKEGTRDTTAVYDVRVKLDCFPEDFAMSGNSTQELEIADRLFKTEVKDAPEQGTDKWLEWRKQGITATEAGMIMFPDSHSSPLTVYSNKLGITTPDQSDPDGYMEWGHRIEDLLVSKFMENHPRFGYCTQGRLYQRDWCKCSLDAQAYDDNGIPVIIECKTGQNENKWNPIPDKYYCQVQWQMYVTGIRKAYFAVLIRGHQYFEKEVDFNPAFVKKMLEKCKVVWDSIQSKTPPASLGINAADKEAIAAMAGISGHRGPAERVEDEVVEEYKRLKTAYDKAEEEFTAFKNTLGFKMVDASKLLRQDGRTFATWVERKGAESIDKVMLQNKYPDIYNECLKTGLPTRYVKYTV